MARLIFLAAYMLLMASFAGRSVAQDKPAPPVGSPPAIMLAQATANGSDVILTLLNPMPVHGIKWVEEEKPGGKKVKVPLTVIEKYVWSEVKVKVDGKEIAAFDVNAKPIDPKDLPERLEKPARVAVVYSFPGFERKLDPFYLGALKNDIVVLKVPAEKFRPAPPKK